MSHQTELEVTQGRYPADEHIDAVAQETAEQTSAPSPLQQVIKHEFAQLLRNQPEALAVVDLAALQDSRYFTQVGNALNAWRQAIHAAGAMVPSGSVVLATQVDNWLTPESILDPSVVSIESTRCLTMEARYPSADVSFQLTAAGEEVTTLQLNAAETPAETEQAQQLTLTIKHTEGEFHISICPEKQGPMPFYVLNELGLPALAEVIVMTEPGQTEFVIGPNARQYAALLDQLHALHGELATNYYTKSETVWSGPTVRTRTHLMHSLLAVFIEDSRYADAVKFLRTELMQELQRRVTAIHAEAVTGKPVVTPAERAAVHMFLAHLVVFAANTGIFLEALHQDDDALQLFLSIFVYIALAVNVGAQYSYSQQTKRR